MTRALAKCGRALGRASMRPASVALCVVLALLLAACSGIQSALDPAGVRAGRVLDLWWLLFWLGTVIFVIVMLLLAWALVRTRVRPDATAPASRNLQRFVWIGGGAVPAIILIALMFPVTSASRDLSHPARTPSLRIDVAGEQWWWRVRYRAPSPDLEFETANEIRIPVGEPVYIRLTSDNVIHSFWVPKLAGKLDLIPGQPNLLWLQADTPGVYRGQCAEYCGLQHAKMAFVVVAEPKARFAAWQERMRQSAPPPSDSLQRAGRDVFMTAGCVSCHTVRGTGAAARVGPELTHVASRLTLAAGWLPNTRGHLAGWVTNPQAIKPGADMPDVNISGPDLQALLAYLESLR